MPDLKYGPLKSKSPQGIIIFLVAVLLLGTAIPFIGSRLQDIRNNNSSDTATQTQLQNNDEMTPTVPPFPPAPNTLVYGYWSQDNSIIKAVDLSSNSENIIAVLPSDIKKVTVASPESLIYIDKTDENDHGKQITLYSLTRGSVSQAISASDGYGIDDYVISPNKQYIATWEVKIATKSAVLYGGSSRVYTVNISNPSVKNLIYDEIADKPVHYPRAILDNGRVFNDTFLPNDPNGGAGWAYGMSVSNFEGTQKQNLAQMANGTYSTQPELSPDGSNLIFVGYDGSNGPGSEAENGYRRALISSNTIETLNTNTLARTKLPLPNTDMYPSAIYDKPIDTSALNIISGNSENTGSYRYTLSSNSMEKISLNEGDSFISSLSDGRILVGTPENSPATMGNLGEVYAPPYLQFSISDINATQIEKIQLPEYLLQYIDLLDANYFGNLNINNTSNISTTPSQKNLNQSGKKDSIQLYTFRVKAYVVPVRSNLQSKPATDLSSLNPENPNFSQLNPPDCHEIGEQMCRRAGEIGGHQAYKTCMTKALTTMGAARASGKCLDSPLYLYGNEGQQIKVTINTPIYNDFPEYKNEYNITLLKNGNMLANDSLTDSIKYDYNPAIKKITPPAYGKIASFYQVADVLKEYSLKLGLNQKETNDLIDYANQNISSPYVFISFFDHETSNTMLPISFTPEPDNYLNIVFYFKQYDILPLFTPEEPIFDIPLNRSGFTAVEVSGIIE